MHICYLYFILRDSNYGTMIRKGVTYKKSVICTTQFAVGLLLKILKYFEIMLNIFEFFHVKEIVASWLVYVNQLHESSNHVS